ncbi:MAG TPA: non-homologous end-joining DNA ligase [Desulfuromonadales bacterium]|nr:non-homologous end-joining DNA ligase [Desulfuromonadales bacterium]
MATIDFLEKLPEKERDKAKKKGLPEWIKPMLATLTDDPFTDPAWLFERKLDGERSLAFVESARKVRLLSRNRKSLNVSYPEIVDALADQTPADCILDGEIVAFNADKVSDFQRLQPRMQASDAEEARNSRIAVYYYIFDCVYLDGYDLAQCSLRSRKQLLKAAIDWQDPLRWTAHRNAEGFDYYRQACRKGWEGLIAKQADSAYVHSRSRKWLKFKCVKRQEFVIGGFTEPEGERIGFGALLLGFYRNDSLVYAGRVGTGFDDQTLKDLHGRLSRIERKTSPYGQGNPEGQDVHFVTPRLVCEVEFTEWTADDKLRHPRFKGLRRDKRAKDVHREEASATTLAGD